MGSGGGQRWSTILTALPGVAAVFLGALYAIGALLTMADLRGAGLRVRDTMPLIPIEDLLARGIGTAIFLSGLLAIAALELAARAALERDDADPLGLMLWLTLLVIGCGAAVTAIVTVPWILAASICAAIVVFFGAQWLIGSWTPWLAALVIVTGLAIDNLAAPAPLPRAALAIENAPPMSGGLIAVNEGAWYLAGDGSVEVVGDGRVESASVASEERGSPADSPVEISKLFWIAVVAIAGFFVWGTKDVWDNYSDARKKKEKGG
ncbi:MAG TPA: hypothetical protein VF712_01670 [Thermoleophilaceae bacterium]